MHCSSAILTVASRENLPTTLNFDSQRGNWKCYEKNKKIAKNDMNYICK
jgi:hypothetical protein